MNDKGDAHYNGVNNPVTLGGKKMYPCKQTCTLVNKLCFVLQKKKKVAASIAGWFHTLFAS